MKKITLNLKLFLKTTVFAVVSLLMVVYVQAQVWNAPTAFPPGDNTPTPINEGTDAQVKDGTLGVNGLGVFGNSIFNADPSIGTYLNFGTISGEGGYGIRDNNGVIECKAEAGDWGECGSGLSSGTSGGACTFAGKKPSGWPDAMMCTAPTGHTYTLVYGGEQSTVGVHRYVSFHGTGYVSFDTSGSYVGQFSFGGYDCVEKSITQIQTEGIGFAMCGGGDSGSSSSVGGGWTEITNDTDDFDTSCEYYTTLSNGVSFWPTSVHPTLIWTEYSSGSGSQMNSSDKSRWASGYLAGQNARTFERCGGTGGGSSADLPVDEIIICSASFKFYIPSDPSADTNGCVTPPYAGGGGSTYSSCDATASVGAGMSNIPPGVHGEIYTGNCNQNYNGSFTVQCMNGTWNITNEGCSPP